MTPLLGSTILPAWLDVGTRRVRLGEVVRRAQSESELDPGQWNDLTELARDVAILAVAHAMRAEVSVLYDA
jgi:hypothetical protein